MNPTGVTLEEAQNLLLHQVGAIKIERVPLMAAYGRVVADPIYSAENVPPFRRSPLDGYALRAADTKGATQEHPARFTVIEEIRAGFTAAKAVTSGTAIKLMTGAPIPNGADTVIRYEAVRREAECLFVTEELHAGDNVVPAGEDMVDGELVARPGDLITAPLVGVLAACGTAEVPVYRKPKAAIFSTGDELVEPGKKLAPGKIHNSNLHSLAARCLELGVEPIYGGIIADDLADTVEKLRLALEQADVVITTGGVSVGDFDLVPKAMEQLGAELLFCRVKMKPGSPALAACKDQKVLIGLSGNPAAAFVTFDLLAAPFLKKLMGLSQVRPIQIEAILADPFTKASPQRRFLRGRLERQYDGNKIYLTGKQTNGVLGSMIGCNVFIDVPAGSSPLTAGQKVTAWLL